MDSRKIVLIVVAASVAVLHQPARGATASPASTARFYVLRVESGQDLRHELQRFATTNNVRAGFIASCTGSVSCASVRGTDEKGTTVREGRYQIVSMSGTLEKDAMHVQAAFSDSAGTTFGGGLMDGSTAFTNTEIVIGELVGLTFARGTDPKTGYKRLVVKKR